MSMVLAPSLTMTGGVWGEVGGWVGGWVVELLSSFSLCARKVEEIEAVRMRRKNVLNGWVGGWVGRTGKEASFRRMTLEVVW